MWVEFPVKLADLEKEIKSLKTKQTVLMALAEPLIMLYWSSI